jgi:hypothetical protein
VCVAERRGQQQQQQQRWKMIAKVQQVAELICIKVMRIAMGLAEATATSRV